MVNVCIYGSVYVYECLGWWMCAYRAVCMSMRAWH